MHACNIVPWFRAYLAEFHGAFFLPPSASILRGVISHIAWSCPPASLLKLNVDASIQAPAGMIGLGAIFRDGEVNVLLSAAIRMELVALVARAEGHAIKFGIFIALDVGLWSLVVESDSLSVINLILQKSVPLMGLVLEDIFHIAGNDSVSTFCFAPRIANRGAHALAQLNCSLTHLLVLLEDYPSSIADVILDDARSSFVS
ncbi:hypothetical protein ACOSQ4_031031 [Xanthoceras sorbifolium]